MDSLCTLIAEESDINSKNPKILSLRNQLEEREKVTLLWLPVHIGIPENEISDKEAIAALKNDL
jgi:ribonuclease HI